MAVKIKDELLKQLCSGVQWQRSVEYMVKQGVGKFIEIGPGKVLAGLIKRISRESGDGEHRGRERGEGTGKHPVTHTDERPTGTLRAKVRYPVSDTRHAEQTETVISSLCHSVLDTESIEFVDSRLRGNDNFFLGFRYSYFRFFPKVLSVS